MKNFKDGMLFPTVALVLICFVFTFALSYTYGMTAPLIEKINQQIADEARSSVLPDAGSDGFKAIDSSLPDGVTEYFIANNGSGVVITSQNKSFGGIMTVMTGIDSTGSITNVTVTAHKDTAGLGTKAMTPDYLAQYSGIAQLDDVASIKADTQVDAVSGATISSNGVYGAVKEALAAYQELGGVN